MLRHRPTRRALGATLLAALLTACAATPVPPAPLPPPSPGPTAASAAPAPQPTASRAPSPRRVVGLGDSIMAGTNCHCDGPLAAYADAVERDRGVRPQVVNRGVSGWTTADLTRLVQTDPTARAQLAEADLVVVIIGANDLFRMGAGQRSTNPSALPGLVATLSDRLAQTLAAVRAAHGAGEATYLVAGYWDILSDRASASTASVTATALVNATIRDAAQDAGMRYVDLDAAFRAAGGPAGLISDDGLHPDAAGVRVIGEALARATP